jgi:hypothetical protein
LVQQLASGVCEEEKQHTGGTIVNMKKQGAWEHHFGRFEVTDL